MEFFESKPLAITIAHEGHVAIRAANSNEDLLMRIVRNASDLSIGSEELSGKISNPYMAYHLSAARADLLRPLIDLISGQKILEIGAECGAITRYLGETGADVTALESDFRQASIAAERCRDLRNVRVVCEQFDNSGFPAALFDVILIVGNRPCFLKPGTPYPAPVTIYQRALSRCRRMLRPDGKLIIAMNNRTGMQQWTDTKAAQTDSPPLFGRKELKSVLDKTGFTAQQWYFPFPDYIFPSVTLHELAFSTPGFNAADLIMPHFLPGTYPSMRRLPEIVAPLLENGLMADMANAFMVISGAVNSEKGPLPALACTFNNTRSNGYKKINTFLPRPEGIQVHRERTFPASPANKDAQIRQHITDETYLPGILYSNCLTKILSGSGWTMPELIVWAHPYYRFLNEQSYTLEGVKLLDGKWIDATPFNLILHDKRRLEPIDLEWETTDAIPLDFVFFRGLYHCLLRTPGFSTPVFNRTMSAFTLIEEILRNFQRSADHAAEQFVRLETRYFQEVIAGKPLVISDFLLPWPLHPDVTARPPEPRWLLPALTTTDIQVFTETGFHSFEEVHSVKRTVELRPSIQSYSIALPPEGEYPSKIRIDPSVRPGMLHFISIGIWEEGSCIYRWSPFSVGGSEEMTDVLLFAVANNPVPVMALTSSDPMMIFSLPNRLPQQSHVQLILEITLAAVKDQDADDLLTGIGRLSAVLGRTYPPAYEK